MLHFLPVLIILSFQGIVFHSTFYGENPETKVQKKKTVFELSSLLCFGVVYLFDSLSLGILRLSRFPFGR